MTIEEKLEKAIDFIRSIEKMTLQTLSTNDIVDITDVYCQYCGDECDYDITGEHKQYVEANKIEKLKDKAWHVLMDIID